MRRRLLLVRHAKSAWDDPTLADHDRPLSQRGEQALRRLRGHLAHVEPAPELVVCSSSRRTRQTLDGVRAALPADVRIEIDAAIYGAESTALLSRLQQLEAATRCAMLIGHNPGVQDLALRLAGSGAPAALDQLASKLPTGAAVTLSWEGDWSELDAGAARVDDLFMPRTPRS